MSIRVGIMGFGRIGRNVFRILNGNEDIEVVAISEVAEPEAVEYLLKYDTVHGRFPDPVSVKGNSMYVRGKEIPIVAGKEPGDANWKELGADYVIEATNKYHGRAQLQRHLDAGAKKVILTGPSHDELDAVLVRGVNDNALQPNHRIVSCSSITANCAALMLKIFHEAFEVDRAFMTTVHAYTNDSRLADVPHTDLRRSRGAAENIIPTETLAPKAVEKVFPEMEGRIDGIAMNVPVPDGSNVDLICEVGRKATVESVNEIVRSAAGSQYKGLVSFVDDPIVSSDVIGDAHSAIFDSLATMVIGERMIKTVTWYDNGWGYAQRVVETLERMACMKGSCS